MGIWASLIFRTGINWNKKHNRKTESDNLKMFLLRNSVGRDVDNCFIYTKNKNFDITPTVAYDTAAAVISNFFFSARHFEDRGNDEFIAGYGFSLSSKTSSGYIVKLKKISLQ